MALYSILSIVAVLCLFYIYTGLGITVLNLLKFKNRDCYLSTLLIPFAIGYGIIGNLLTLFGYLQVISIYTILLLLILASLISLLSLNEILKLNQQIVKSLLTFKTFFNQNRIVSILLVIMLLGYFVRSLLPPTGFDGLMYHLSTVKLYLQKGGFWNIYFNPQSDFPMLTEMHFMIGLALKNDIITKGISFLLFLLVLILIKETSKYLLLSFKESCLSILIFMSLSVVVANVPNCDVDIPQALWAGIAILIMLEYDNNRSRKNIYIAVFIAGLSVQSKIFGVFIIPIILILLYIYFKKNIKNNKELFISATIIPILMGAVWYVKSIVFTGAIIPGKIGEKISFVDEGSFIIQMYDLLKSVVFAPWHYSLFPSWHRGDTIGPIFIMILPFLFFVGRNKRVNLILITCLIYVLQISIMDIFILKHGSSIRYMLTILMLLSPVVVYVLSNLDKSISKKVLYTFVIVSISINVIVFIKRYHQDWIALLRQSNRNEYISSILPEYDVIMRINQLSDNQVVMPVYNFSEYLIDKNYITAFKKYSSKEVFLKDMEKYNIGYVFANNVLDTSENINPYPFIDKELVFNSNGFYLYKIKGN